MRVEEWESRIGEQIRRARLLDDVTQRELAERANVGVVTLQNLEAGHGSSLATLIRVLRALNRTDWLDTLEPEPQVSPLAIARAAEAARGPRRASSRRGGK